jgi:hypothetical protein
MKIKKHLSFSSLRKALSSHFGEIPDERQAAKIKISQHDMLMSGFACMYFQDPSLLQFQVRMQDDQHRNNLSTLFEVETIPKETQMREHLDEVDSEHFRGIFKEYYLRLQRGKHLEEMHFFQNNLLSRMFCLRGNIIFLEQSRRIINIYLSGLIRTSS